MGTFHGLTVMEVISVMKQFRTIKKVIFQVSIDLQLSLAVLQEPGRTTLGILGCGCPIGLNIHSPYLQASIKGVETSPLHSMVLFKLVSSGYSVRMCLTS